MVDHPSTFNAAQTDPQGIQWDDRASVHSRDDGDGLFDAMKGLYRGSLAEMVALVSRMPAEERGKFVIQKAGDRRIEGAEIMQLAEREDFPLRQ